jgi:hypothetical protein
MKHVCKCVRKRCLSLKMEHRRAVAYEEQRAVGAFILDLVD